MKHTAQRKNTSRFTPIVLAGRKALFAVQLDTRPGMEPRHLSMWTGPQGSLWIGSSESHAAYGVIPVATLRRFLDAADAWKPGQ